MIMMFQGMFAILSSAFRCLKSAIEGGPEDDESEYEEDEYEEYVEDGDEGYYNDEIHPDLLELFETITQAKTELKAAERLAQSCDVRVQAAEKAMLTQAARILNLDGGVVLVQGSRGCLESPTGTCLYREGKNAFWGDDVCLVCGDPEDQE